MALKNSKRCKATVRRSDGTKNRCRFKALMDGFCPIHIKGRNILKEEKYKKHYHNYM